MLDVKLKATLRRPTRKSDPPRSFMYTPRYGKAIPQLMLAKNIEIAKRIMFFLLFFLMDVFAVRSLMT